MNEFSIDRQKLLREDYLYKECRIDFLNDLCKSSFPLSNVFALDSHLRGALHVHVRTFTFNLLNANGLARLPKIREKNSFHRWEEKSVKVFFFFCHPPMHFTNEKVMVSRLIAEAETLFFKDRM